MNLENTPEKLEDVSEAYTWLRTRLEAINHTHISMTLTDLDDYMDAFHEKCMAVAPDGVPNEGVDLLSMAQEALDNATLEYGEDDGEEGYKP